jgi:hypothetical protein
MAKATMAHSARISTEEAIAPGVPIADVVGRMLGLIRRKRRGEDDKAELARAEEPNPVVALAVGLIYVFRTAAGARIMRELEHAVRKYAADPQALWRLVREGEGAAPPGDVIDTTVAEPKELPPTGEQPKPNPKPRG